MVMMMMDKTYKYITVQDFLALVLARSIQGIKCNELMKIDFCGWFGYGTNIKDPKVVKRESIANIYIYI